MSQYTSVSGEDPFSLFQADFYHPEIFFSKGIILSCVGLCDFVLLLPGKEFSNITVTYILN